MNLIRLLLLVVLAWLAFSVFRRWLQGQSVARRKPAAPDRQERMVKCVYCGLHVPESEAVRAGGLNYCSIEHRDAHAPRG